MSKRYPVYSTQLNPNTTKLFQRTMGDQDEDYYHTVLSSIYGESRHRKEAASAAAVVKDDAKKKKKKKDLSANAQKKKATKRRRE